MLIGPFCLPERQPYYCLSPLRGSRVTLLRHKKPEVLLLPWKHHLLQHNKHDGGVRGRTQPRTRETGVVSSNNTTGFCLWVIVVFCKIPAWRSIMKNSFGWTLTFLFAVILVWVIFTAWLCIILYRVWFYFWLLTVWLVPNGVYFAKITCFDPSCSNRFLLSLFSLCGFISKNVFPQLKRTCCR